MVEAAPDEAGHRSSRHVCPRCGGPVHITHRNVGDRLVSIVYRVRRYRCRTDDCGWQGLLAGSRGAPTFRSRPVGWHAPWIAAGVLLIPLAGLSAAVYWLYHDEVKPIPVSRGHSIAGTPLEPGDPRWSDVAPTGSLRRGCSWEGSDASPYRGTVTAALTAAQLPREIVRKIEIMREGRLVSDRLEISNAGIHSTDHRRYFGDTTKVMTVGDAICFSTRVDLPPETTIAADLYELVDDHGRRYSIMVVARSGNVAVLDELPER